MSNKGPTTQSFIILTVLSLIITDSACQVLRFNITTLPDNPGLKGDLTNFYIGDFNGDGRDDFLRQEKGYWDDGESNTANIYLSLGDGTFQRIDFPENLALKGDFTNLYIGDFDGDGKDDFIRQEKDTWDDDAINTASVFLSLGDGTFSKIDLPEDFALKGDLTRLYIGDFDGDGKDDFISTTNIFLSLGDGTFSKIDLPEDLILNSGITNLYIGDFDGDGRDDVMNTANVFLSFGDGTFNKIDLPEDFALNGDLADLYIGDFDGDGRDDFLQQEKGIWDDNAINTANVFLSLGDGTFNKTYLPEDFALNGDRANLYIGDFNGDGRDDFLRQEKGDWDDDAINTANIFLSFGDGTFDKTDLPEEFALNGDLTNLYIGDFDGDGIDDFLRQEKGVWDDDSINTANVFLTRFVELQDLDFEDFVKEMSPELDAFLANYAEDLAGQQVDKQQALQDMYDVLKGTKSITSIPVEIGELELELELEEEKNGFSPCQEAQIAVAKDVVLIILQMFYVRPKLAKAVAEQLITKIEVGAISQFQVLVNNIKLAPTTMKQVIEIGKLGHAIFSQLGVTSIIDGIKRSFSWYDWVLLGTIISLKVTGYLATDGGLALVELATDLALIPLIQNTADDSIQAIELCNEGR